MFKLRCENMVKWDFCCCFLCLWLQCRKRKLNQVLNCLYFCKRKRENLNPFVLEDIRPWPGYLPWQSSLFLFHPNWTQKPQIHLLSFCACHFVFYC